MGTEAGRPLQCYVQNIYILIYAWILLGWLNDAKIL